MTTWTTRAEHPQDVAAIRAVNIAAFPADDEANLVDVLRADPAAWIDGLSTVSVGSARFMLPGGKPDSGESAAQTAVREVREELSVHLEPAALQPIGIFRAAAANEPGFDVESTVFEHPPVSVSRPGAEIEELRWQLLEEPYPADLAPLLAEHVLPILSGKRPRP